MKSVWTYLVKADFHIFMVPKDVEWEPHYVVFTQLRFPIKEQVDAIRDNIKDTYRRDFTRRV